MKNKIFCASVQLLALFLFFWIMLVYPQTTYATAPKDVKLSYNLSTQTLTVTITHKTLAQNFHYIKYVEIKKNGATVSNNKYNNQPDPETFTYTYNLAAGEGDKLEVTAICSLWGSKTTFLDVTKM